MPVRPPPHAVALAMYLCELSLLDSSVLAQRASAVAAAALVAATACSVGAAAGARAAQDIARLTGMWGARAGCANRRL